ncbi:MAG: ribbon-helix-helix protein, CopG family [Planctomycetes bacterium]|nr:ribbon-helix-helix protein, CopG family [Planctomycetota bacterium]
MNKTISFQLDDSLLERLDEVVGQGDANRSEVLRRMIEKLLDDRAAIGEALHRKDVVS